MPNAPAEGNSVLRVLIKYSILVIRARGLGGSAGCVAGGWCVLGGSSALVGATGGAWSVVWLASDGIGTRIAGHDARPW